MKSDVTIDDKSSGLSFSIVGIGASAGGLNALECFVSALPKEFGFAIVFMQHLSTKHRSLLPELLRKRRQDIDIIEISGGLKVLPGKLFLCPPGKVVKIQKETFEVGSPPEEHVRMPIDELFVSLAEVAGERTIGVIFSGAGTDGARGIQAIRSAGGTVFVQDPATAEFTSMPLAAISTGQADGVFTPEEIAREILKLQSPVPVMVSPDSVITPEDFGVFYKLLHDKAGYNFNLYKKSVVARRISRRMYLSGATTVNDYLQLLSENGPEINNLAMDLMIGVTSFFRDPLAWKALMTGVIRKLTAANDASPVRVWTPACATGEEAYSIAIMLYHEFELAGRRKEIQIFATDVNERALEKAREGKYPAGISSEVPPDFMKKYFTYTEDGLSAIISKEIRELVVFAKHDILTDPPFSHLDLVICRNLLIYLEPEAQEKCIVLFHYSLKNNRFLFLGNAESPAGRNISLFKSLAHKKCRIYEKAETKPTVRMPISVPIVAEKAEQLTSQQKAEECKQSVTGTVQEALLEKYAPAAVAVNQNYDILYHNGPTNRYLCQPRGAPTQNLLELMPESLRNRLRSRIRGGLYKAINEARAVSVSASIVGDDKRKRQVTLRISKLEEDLFLIVFREKGALPEQEETAAVESVAVEETAVRQLESELSATRLNLQSNIEQLKSLNEEMQSSNEELQAANEELETSREELQSLNEELITVNAQLQSKIEEQETTNNDLNNFLSSTNIPTIFLDHQFRVKLFTPAMSRLIKLIPADVGRPLMDMSRENLGPDLIVDAQSVLDNLSPIKKEFMINGAWYVRSALPYRTLDNRIEGIVITYNDVTEIKKVEERTRHLASFPQLNPNPILELDSKGTVVFVNPAAQKILEEFGMNRDDYSVFLPADIEGVVSDLKKNEELVYDRELTIKDRVFAANIYLTPRFNVVRIYVFDITERKRAEHVMQARLRLAAAAYAGNISVDEILRLTLDEIEAQTGSIIGFYHFLEADQETLSLQGWSTNTIKTMCNAEGKGSHYNISQAGVWVDCVRERHPVIHNDYASLPQRKGMPEGHAKVVRELVIPIIRGERIVAIIGVGNKPTDYNETDVGMALLLGDFSWEIVEGKKAEAEIQTLALQRQMALDAAQLGWWQYNPITRVAEWDDGYKAIFGVSGYTRPNDEILAQIIHPDDLPALWAKVEAALNPVDPQPYAVEYRINRPDGALRWIEAHGTVTLEGEGENRRAVNFVGTVADITERKRAEEERETSVEFLNIVNESRNTEALIHAATDFFQKSSGCEAVGIRLRHENDYPYYETRGFPQKFVLLETRLCALDKEGRPILDSLGDPILECMCGNVICGRFDPSKPFFTAKGSFWSNCTTDLLASTTDSDRQARTRNRCNGEGYESVALIALRSGGERLGLLQLNDKRKGRFTLEGIALWERLADYLSVALAKFESDAALKESEEQFRTLADSIPNLAWWADADGYITWYNQRWYVYTGTTPKEMEGWGWQSVHDPKVLPKVLERWKASIATGEPFDMEFPLLGADGVFRPFLTRVMPLKDSAGRVLRWFGTNTDVTEHKLAEIALKRSMERFELLAGSAGELLQDSEPQKVVESICRKVMENLDCHIFFNFLVDEKAGRLHLNSYAGISGEDAKRIEWLDFGIAVCGCVARDAKRIVAEHIYSTPDERTELLKYYGINAFCCHPLLGPEGKVIGTLAFGTNSRETFSDDDLSLMKAVADQVAVAIARMQAKEELERLVTERTRFYSVLAKTSEAIVRFHEPQALFEEVCRIVVEEGSLKLAWVGLLDENTREVRPVASYGESSYLDGIIIRAADVPEGKGPTGLAVYEDRHVINKDFEEDPRMLPWRDKARAHGLRSSSAFPIRVGPRVVGAFTIYSDRPSFFTAEEISLFLSLAEDVSFALSSMETEKKRCAVEEDLRLLNEELELRVRRRTSELEVVNKELDAFIYSVSHDLRAPLRIISGFIGMLAEDYAVRLDEQGRDYLNRIYTGSEKMSKLIDDLLYLSRISRHELDRIEFNISNKVSSIFANLREADPGRSVEVSIEEGLVAFADPGLTDIVLTNLLGNAWKFTSETENAGIKFGSFEQYGKTVYYVRDNGAGFDPNYKEKLFAPFQRLHSDREFGGSGIGLSIVERVIRLHGGKVWAEGETGKGASFFFTLN